MDYLSPARSVIRKVTFTISSERRGKDSIEAKNHHIH